MDKTYVQDGKLITEYCGYHIEQFKSKTGIRYFIVELNANYATWIGATKRILKELR